MKQYLIRQLKECVPGIIYALSTISLVYVLCMLCGCGHNIYLERETTGFRLDIPIGDGTVGFAVGSDKTVRATVRGGASFETSSSNGGGLFSGAGGQSKITQFKSNSQLNEGNLKDVLISPEVPAEAKVILASNLADGVSAPYFPGSILQTKESTIHIGRAAIQSNNVTQIQSNEPQGLDKVVDSVTTIIGTNVVNGVLNTTGGIVHDVVNPLEGTVTEVKETVTKVDNTITNTATAAKELLWDIVLVIIGVVLVVSLIAILISKTSKTKKKRLRIDTSYSDLPKDTKPKPKKKKESAPPMADTTTTPTEPITTAAVFPELPNNAQVQGETLIVNTVQDLTKTAEEQPVQEQPKVKAKSNKFGWVKKTFDGIVSTVKYLYNAFFMLPPGVRKAIGDFIKRWWENRKAAKAAKAKDKK